MLDIKIYKETPHEIEFRYYPDGGNIFGIIVVSKVLRKIIALQNADNDEFGTYKVHAVKRVSQYIKEQNYPSEDVVAWY